MGSHAGILVFGNSPRVLLRLNDYQSISNLENTIDRLTVVGGSRNIDRALEEGARLFLNSRTNVPRLAFVLTTGRQTGKLGGSGKQHLMDMNARVIVIGVGQSSKYDVEQFKQIASTPRDVFLLQSVENSLAQVPMILQHIKRKPLRGM